MIGRWSRRHSLEAQALAAQEGGEERQALCLQRGSRLVRLLPKRGTFRLVVTPGGFAPGGERLDPILVAVEGATAA